MTWCPTEDDLASSSENRLQMYWSLSQTYPLVFPEKRLAWKYKLLSPGISFKQWSRGHLDREVGSYIWHLKFVTWCVYIQMMRRHSTCPWFGETYNANNLFCWLGCYSTFQSSSSSLLKLEASEKGVWVFFFFFFYITRCSSARLWIDLCAIIRYGTQEPDVISIGNDNIRFSLCSGVMTDPWPNCLHSSLWDRGRENTTYHISSSAPPLSSR